MDATVLIPLYNDWDSAVELLWQLDLESGREHRLFVVFVDDGSTQARPHGLISRPFSAIVSVIHLRLKCNMGHQRAIAAALSWLGSQEIVRPVVIMDGDGEDRPSDVPRMLRVFEQWDGAKAIFAERTKRSESFLFKQFYNLYRWLHRIMIGFPVKIGNFSVIPPGHVEGLIVSNSLWYHYAATVIRTRLPYELVKTSRGTRYKGESKMNFVSLVRHGISAIAVHAEVLSVRMLIASCIITLLGVGTLCALVWIRVSTSLAIPGWATTMSGLVVIALLQVLSVAFTFALQSVSIHANTSFLPLRDGPLFLHSVQQVPLLNHPKQVNVQ